MKVFPSLLGEVTENHTYKSIDKKVVLGSQHTKTLHAQPSTIAAAINDEIIQSVYVQHNQDVLETRSIAEKVINVDKTTTGIIHMCSNNDCCAQVLLEDGICKYKCDLIGTIDGQILNSHLKMVTI